RGRVVAALRPAPNPRRFSLRLLPPFSAKPRLHQQMQPKTKKEKTPMTTTTKTLTKADLAQFTGSETWYRHALVRDVLFTDGARHVADAGGAYWLPERRRSHAT